MGIKIIPYPSTSHVKLVKRDLSRKRPFQENGKGYRDALIWESVKNICKKSSSLFEAPEIIFVNKNHTDFCKHDVLHPDLKEDLVNHGINEDYVEIVNDIDIFIQKYIKPKQKILKDILLNINKNKYYKEIDFKIEVEKRTSDFLLHREFDYEESPFRQEFENPSIVSVDDISYTVTDVRQISEEEILIEIEVDANCEFDFFIFKSDAICMDNDELPNIWSSDWNKHYMGASDSKYVKLEISLIVDSTFSKIQSDNMKIIPTKIY